MNIRNIIINSALRFPQETALVYKGQRITYQELDIAVSTVAANFSNFGIRTGDRVALCLRNSLEFVYTVFALAQIGAVAVPINFFLSSEEIAYICAHSQARALITQTQFLKTVQTAIKKAACVQTLWCAGDCPSEPGSEGIKPFAELLEGASPPSKPLISSEELILLLYTSGTTGKPKGVMLTHKNLLTNAQACQKALTLSVRDRFICLLPLFHVFAWTANMVLPLLMGSKIVLIEIGRAHV